MGIGLLIAGRTSSAAAPLLGTLEAWFRRACADTLEFAAQGRDSSERPALFLRFHPGAEDVEISAAGPRRVAVSAKTSTAGPGYHRYLCGILRTAGAENGVEWLPADEVEETGDEGGYFHTGDAGAVEGRMLSWLRSLASQVLEMDSDGCRNISVSMPEGRQFEAEGAAITPMGPRDRDWFEAASRDPAGARDIFPWWDDRFDAGYQLGRALVRMWIEVPWRPPLDDEERALLRDVADRLAAAYRLDRTLPYPWREWREILGYLGEPAGAELEAGALLAKGPLVGYRRGAVRVALAGGWTVRIPGALKESMGDDGRWSAWGPGRAVWFTSFRFASTDGRVPPEPRSLLADFRPEPGERIPELPGAPPSAASFGETREDGRPLWRLEGRVALPGHMAVCDIFVEDPREKDWALEVWRSIRHP